MSSDAETNLCVIKSKSEYLWKINNFNVELAVYTSPVFEYGPIGCKWFLKYYPLGEAKKNSEESSLYLLVVEDSTPSNARVEFSIKIKNSQKEVLASTGVFKSCVNINGASDFPKVSIDIKDLKKHKLPNDELLIYCGIEYVCDNVASASSNVNMKDKMSRIFNNAKFSDFTLHNGLHMFPVHKCVLAASSPVFEAMLSCDLEENQKNKAILDGTVGHNVIQEMLIFMYTGEAPNVDQLANELIGVADKYDVQDLKRICADALMRQVTVQNAAETLILSDLYRVDDLKKQSIKFIIDHSDVLTTNDWKYLTENNTKLLEETFRSLLIAYENKSAAPTLSTK